MTGTTTKLWETEPNEWHGELCCAIRHTVFLHWCGYVFIPPGHPWHGAHIDDLEDVVVHGGVTWAGKMPDLTPRQIRTGAPPGYWWVGFDCAHFGDVAPGRIRIVSESYRDELVYRTLPYVQEQILHLMRQAAHAVHGWDHSQHIAKEFIDNARQGGQDE